jgi:superfamily II DNA/RNA helicase
VSYLVLDEADKLLAMGFAEQVDALLAAASSPHIIRAFFSATLPDKVCGGGSQKLGVSGCERRGLAD